MMMKNSFLFLAVVIAFMETAKAQTTYFSKIYDYNNQNEGSNSIVVLDDGYLVVYGTISFNPQNPYSSRLLIAKLNKLGDTLWSRIYGNEGNYYQDGKSTIIPAEDGGFIIGAIISNNSTGERSPWVLRLNSSGDTLWTKAYHLNSGKFRSLQNIIKTTDNGYAICGEYADTSSYTSQSYLLKINSNGVERFEKIYPGYYDSGYSMLQLQDKGYLIAGRMASGLEASTSGAIWRTDSLGNLTWKKTYGHSYGRVTPFIKIVRAKDNNYVVCSAVVPEFDIGKANAYILKVNEQGKKLWDRMYEFDYYDAFENVTELADSSFMLTGQSRSPEFSDSGAVRPFTMRVTATGKPLWAKGYTYNGRLNDEYMRDIKPTDDGGFVMSGFTTDRSRGSGGQDVWILKVDSLGCDSPGCRPIILDVYDPLIADSARWNVMSENYAPHYTRETYIYVLGEDTLIKGITYKKIVESGRLDGYIREDTSARRVFYQSIDTTEDEILLYAFSLKEGDTIQLYNWRNEPVSFKVDSVYETTIMAGKRDALRLNMQHPFLKNTLVWIEGVGSTQGIRYLIDDGSLESKSTLLCSYQNGEQVYDAGPQWECYETNVGIANKDFLQASVLLFPNPSSGGLNIKLNTLLFGSCKVRIYDVFSREIYHADYQWSPVLSISFPDVENGLYYCSVEADGKVRGFSKVMLLKGK